jgi:hypothetical protein
MITRSDLLKPRARSVEEEEQRERFFGPGAGMQNKSASQGESQPLLAARDPASL